MRAVRVLGLAEDGQEVVCEDPATGEKFLLPRDEKLRAASRGDLSRFGQLEIEGESQLRPKEIQARIRAGATVAELAALAGTSSRRIDRFAYPVLVERATMAERARHARPSIDGVSAATSVEQTVAATLAARGHDGTVTWDAFRDHDDWVLLLTWHAGRSENRASWTFHPGPAGGTLTARDEAAAEIVDPALRGLRPLREARTDLVNGAAPAPPPMLDPTVPTEPAVPVTRPEPKMFERRPPAGSPRPAPRRTPVAPPMVEPDAAESDQTAAQDLAESTVTDERAGAHPAPKESEIAKTGTDSPSARSPKRGSRPTMPSWEDVLLGTRSHGH